MSRTVAGGAPEAVAGTLLERPGHLSFSQLKKLSPRYERSCPRSWAYDKLLGVPSRGGTAMILGGALDRAVTAFFTRRMCRDDAVASCAVAAGVLERYIEGHVDWPDDIPREPYLLMMGRALTVFAEEFNTTVPAALQAPHLFEVAVPGGTRSVIGFSDWIDADGTIVDLKFTGTPKWNKDGIWYEEWIRDVHDQLTSYHMGRLYDDRAGHHDGVAPLNPRGRVVVVVAALSRKEPMIRSREFDLTGLDISTVADVAREADALARADTHPQRPGLACQMCSYVSRCRIDSARLAAPTTELSR